MIKKIQEKGTAKKAYLKPVVKTIDLAASEVLAEGCKQRLTGSAFGATPCRANNCARQTNS